MDRPTGTLSWDDVSTDVMKRLGVAVDRVNWFSTYHVHHRVAQRFRRGRAFVLGDAAHIHSPVGAQGMNTGIADAVNLAWKLAAVLRGADAGLLDTYEPERIAFARRLVATTDRAFTAVVSPGRLARFVRTEIVPRVMPLLFARGAVRRFMFRTISQTTINYRHSILSQGSAGSIRGGDRLPWVPGEGQVDNFSPLESLDWQVHIYGQPDTAVAHVCRQRGISLHAFPWTPGAERAGLARNALYLVRPDGYVGLAQANPEPGELEGYLNTWCSGLDRRLPVNAAGLVVLPL
jgi:hypothetical protein